MRIRTGAKIAVSVIAGVAIIAGVWAFLAVPRSDDAQERLAAAIAAGDDAAVESMFQPAVWAAISKDSTQGASAVLLSRIPGAESLAVRKVNGDEVWLVSTVSPDARLELRKAAGWKVTSASYYETQTVTEPLTFPKTVHKTEYLPRGTTIVVTNPVEGKAERTHKVLMRDGQEIRRSETGFVVLIKPVTGEAYVGTGSKGKGVTNFLVGSRFDRAAIRVTNDGDTVDAKDGRLGATWRMANPVSGDRQRLILLGPSANTSLGTMKKLKSADWVESGASFSMPNDSPWKPLGKWIAIVETNGKPGTWRVVTVK